MGNKRFIKASEYSQWEYCPRQWYLHKTKGRKSNTEASRRGIAYHNNMSQGVKSVQHEQSNFIATLVIGGIIVCILFFSLR
jgi:hypothetical protein